MKLHSERFILNFSHVPIKCDWQIECLRISAEDSETHHSFIDHLLLKTLTELISHLHDNFTFFRKVFNKGSQNQFIFQAILAQGFDKLDRYHSHGTFGRVPFVSDNTFYDICARNLNFPWKNREFPGTWVIASTTIKILHVALMRTRLACVRVISLREHICS